MGHECTHSRFQVFLHACGSSGYWPPCSHLCALPLPSSRTFPTARCRSFQSRPAGSSPGGLRPREQHAPRPCLCVPATKGWGHWQRLAAGLAQGPSLCLGRPVNRCPKAPPLHAVGTFFGSRVRRLNSRGCPSPEHRWRTPPGLCVDQPQVSKPSLLVFTCQGSRAGCSTSPAHAPPGLGP